MAYTFKSRLKHRAVIDLTSLIDLVFLLVAFFMVTSSLGSESSITVHLPKAVQSGESQKSTLVISIDDKDNVYLNDAPVKKETLYDEFVKQRSAGKIESVVIRGDKQASYQTIVKVMDDLNRAGIPKFTLATTK